MKLGCVLMAAGSSSRFGSNKLLQEAGGVPLYRRAMNAVPTELFTQVCVVTGWEPIAKEAKARGFTVVCNDRPELGVSRTIRLGLEQLLHCDGVVFMTADQPFLTAETLKKLAAAFSETPGCILAAAHNGQRGNPCLFPKSCFSELLQLQGDKGGGRVIAQHNDLLRLVEVPAVELADADTPEALEKLTTLPLE